VELPIFGLSLFERTRFWNFFFQLLLIALDDAISLSAHGSYSLARNSSTSSCLFFLPHSKKVVPIRTYEYKILPLANTIPGKNPESFFVYLIPVFRDPQGDYDMLPVFSYPIFFMRFSVRNGFFALRSA